MKTRLKVVVAAVLALAGHGAFAADAETEKKAAVERALALIQSNPASFSVATPASSRVRRSTDSQGLASSSTAPPTQGDEFKPRDVILDKDGTEHVRFDRFHQGLHVIGGDIVVHSKEGQSVTSSLTMRNAIQLPATLAKVDGRTVIQNAPDIGADRAKGIAAERFGNGVERSDAPQLVVFARDKTPVLAYEVRVFGAPNERHADSVVYYVGAGDGAILDSQDLAKRVQATGAGRSLYYGDLQFTTDKFGANSYRMVDPSRGDGEVLDGRDLEAGWLAFSPDLVPFTSPDNKWGNGATNDRKTVAVDISYGLAKTWDYFKQIHGRNGIFDDGRGVKSYAHVVFRTDRGGMTGANAQWRDGGVMAYGDGAPGTLLPGPVVSIDVAGHEMSHGVTEATSKLAYSRDAGGLNEATSDIFGTLVKYYANNANDPGNYVIGARIQPNGLRKMYKQDIDGQSFVCYPRDGFRNTSAEEVDAHNPHVTSGVGNRFFYLLAEGAVVPSTDRTLNKSDLVCPGQSTNLAGIGREKAGKIWYRMLTVYLNANSTYPDARAGSIQAASDLYGANSVAATAVARAWSAVLVN
ncbi:M4 family metallopeptidase [Variovorax sp. 770b2]|uniref:M4 family metallopeptidase n=1 Tax=Variovorax sp. 770b2 TaxID=1566271 RepID=UPI0008F0E79C|nr:M4 family metallopeptidase [Variovorax sp. 770b2]SFP19940.1 ZmpA-like peptidase. Metallo peptidase. MEROPS family M04 [Variovorax sp. 770b2]